MWNYWGLEQEKRTQRKPIWQDFLFIPILDYRVFLFIACANYIVTTFMVDYANIELGFNFSKASSFVTIRGLSQVVGVLTIPFISDRIGRKMTIAGSNLLIVLSTLGLIASGKELPILLTSIALSMVSFPGPSGLCTVHVREIILGRK